jgi:hypothetical protein
MDLLSVLTDIFESRGYEVLVSSRENSYLLLKRNMSTMAAGFSEPGHRVTEGEAEMFISMAENSSADSMLFISPEKLERDVRIILEKANCSTWDRMALAIAIGEQVLSEPPEKRPDEDEKEDAFDPGVMMDLFSDNTADPLIIESDKDPVREAKSESVMEAEPISVSKMEFPDGIEGAGQGKEKKASNVSEDVLLNAWAGFDDWKRSEEDRKESEDLAEEKQLPIPDLPMMESLVESPPEKKPWIGSILAPTRCKKEEACVKAGVPNDTELDMEHVPNLLVSVSYSLRAEDGATVSREGEYLYDPIKGGLIDIPSALAEELRTTLSVWDGKGPVKGLEGASEDDKGYIRALKDRLTRERHAEDRMVRETLMSTIYQEVRYLFDPSSFNIRWSRRVVVPYWVKREDGGIKWMVDGYLGRFIQSGARS